MSTEIHAPECRGGEWRCLCIKGIRAASCPKCHRCGAERPMDTAAMVALTSDAIEALDIFRKACRLHGNEVAAMGDVLTWWASRRARA